jgi:hypothetical protein
MYDHKDEQTLRCGINPAQPHGNSHPSLMNSQKRLVVTPKPFDSDMYMVNPWRGEQLEDGYYNAKLDLIRLAQISRRETVDFELCIVCSSDLSCERDHECFYERL